MSGWTLHKKILVNLVAVILLLWLSDEFIHHTILYRVLKAEFQQWGIDSAKSIAANSVTDILIQNSKRLKQLLENEKRLHKGIAYIFIINSNGQVIAHTFDKGFPIDLLKTNDLEREKDFSIKTLDTQLGFIDDIAVPVFSENNFLGQMHLGILRNIIQKSISAVDLTFTIIAVIVLIIGMFLVYRVAYLITAPISKLVEAARSIQRGNFSARIDVKTKDEIGQLSCAFNEMALRLNNMMEELRRLSVFEERNRIALDLHDGRAQDLADIIKRVELCEKLFKIEPDRAFQEMNILKENTKGILNRTRQVIFDLKSAEDGNLDLLDNLSSFVRDFEKENDIIVALDIPDKITIPFAKAKTVSYIIAEAFSNIKKHAQTKRASLSLKLKENSICTIDIKDYGKGFDVNSEELRSMKNSKLGLMSMRQRAISLGGVLVIDSASEKGTTVTVNIPLI